MSALKPEIGMPASALKLHLDGDRRTPVYRQIVEQIMHQVAMRQLKQGERLPTVRQLAAELHVDRNTALRAYRILQHEGVISLQHGRGTFVCSHPDRLHLTRHRRIALEDFVDSSVARALSLGYSPAEIERAFRKRLKYWQHARRSSGGA